MCFIALQNRKKLWVAGRFYAPQWRRKLHCGAQNRPDSLVGSGDPCSSAPTVTALSALKVDEPPQCFPAVCFPGCWNVINDVHGHGGRPVHSITSVIQCQEACLSNSLCLAVNYNHNDVPHCWLLTKDYQVGRVLGISHYILDRNCTGTSQYHCPCLVCCCFCR